MTKPTNPPAGTLYLNRQTGQMLEFDGESWKRARSVYSTAATDPPSPPEQGTPARQRARIHRHLRVLTDLYRDRAELWPGCGRDVREKTPQEGTTL